MRPPKGKNFFLGMRSTNFHWLRWKIESLKDFYNNEPRQENTTYRCNSICCEAFTDLYLDIYEDGKRMITMDLLDGLCDTALAMWYIDGGSKTGRDRKNAYITTTKYGEEGTKIIHKYFNEVGIPCNIGESKERFRILFTVEGTDIFFRTVAHRFPPFMYGCMV